MGQVFKNQTKLKITVNLKEDITGYKKVYVKYKKPSGTDGKFEAKVQDAGNGVIYYDVQSKSDINESGNWTFWGYVIFNDDKEIAGEIEKVKILEEGSQN